MKVVSETTLAARETLATLTAKREAVTATLEGINVRRQEIAYEAMTGGRAAADELEQLADEAMRIRHQSEDLNRAVTVARERLEAAEMADAMEAKRQDAARALELIEDLRKHLSGLDRKARELSKAVEGAQYLAREIHSLTGDSGTGGELFEINLRNALSQHFTGILRVPLIPPNQRIALGDLGLRCTALAETRARAVLNREVAA